MPDRRRDMHIPAAARRWLRPTSNTTMALLALLALLALAACGQDQTAATDTSDSVATSDGNGLTDGQDSTTSEVPDMPDESDAANGSSADPTTDASGSDEPGSASGAGPSGTVAVRLEPVEGVFIEGFEVGLRIETADGELVAATLWSEHVADQGNASIEDYYNSVYEVSAPAGDIVILATVNVGLGPAPETPDIHGDLDCRLAATLPEGGELVVEVSFSGEPDCLRQV